MSEKTIIEINGVKLEVDLREATVIENYKVGQSVKVLYKQYSSYESQPGVIIGFSNYKMLPTIEILTCDYSGEVKFRAYNAESKDIEIAPFNKYEKEFQYDDILRKLQGHINDYEERLRVAKSKYTAFVELFHGICKSE